MDFKEILESLNKTNIIENLLTPTPIVAPGAMINNNLEWSIKFNKGRDLFLNKNYDESAQQFHELDEALPRQEVFLTPAKINESFCWLYLDRFEEYIEKWEPFVKLGRVYGLSLWNLGLAYYKVGETTKAESCLKDWIESPSLRFLTNAYLLLSMLQVRNEKMEEAISSFDTAVNYNIDLCVRVISNYLGNEVGMALLESEKTQTLLEKREKVVGEDEVLLELEKILVARSPIKYPQLAEQLSEFEYQTGYITALEKFGDGDIDEALRLIDSLLKGTEEKEALKWAKAAFLAAQHKWNESIEVIDEQLDDLGIPGSVHWNAACAYFYLGNYDFALESIRNCLYLEYQTSGITWLIKGFLAHLCGENNIRDDAINEATRIFPKQLIYYIGVLRQIGIELEELQEDQIQTTEVRDEEINEKYSNAINEAQILVKKGKQLQAAEKFIQFSPRKIMDIPEVEDTTFSPVIIPTCPEQLYDYKETFLSGINAFRSKGFEEAIKKFEDIYSKINDSYPAAINLTASLIVAEKYSRAIDILLSVIEKKKIGGAIAIRNLISALIRADKPEQAFPWFSKLLEVSNKEYFNFVQMALIAYRLGLTEDIATALYNACTKTLSEPSILLKGAAIKACIDVKDHDRAVVLVKYFTKEIQPPYVVAGVTRPAIPAKDCIRYYDMKNQYERFMRQSDKRAAIAYFKEVHSAREADYSDSIDGKTVNALFNACEFYGQSLFWNEDFEHGHEILRQALTILTEHSKFYSKTSFLSKRYLSLTNIYFKRKHYFWALELCERGLEIDKENSILLSLNKEINRKIKKIPEISRKASQKLTELPLSTYKNTDEFFDLLPKVSQQIQFLPQDFPDSKKTITELIDVINILLGIDSIPLIQRKKKLQELGEKLDEIEGELSLYLPKTFISSLLPVLKGIKKELNEFRKKSVVPEFHYKLEPVGYYRETEATLVCKLRNIGAADIHNLQIKIEADISENWVPLLEDKSFDIVKKDEQLWIDLPIYFNSTPPPEEIQPKFTILFTGGMLKGELVEQTFSEQKTQLIPFTDISVNYPVMALNPDETNKLYGRENLLRTLKNSFTRSGQTRIPFLEGVRKVGKTSILYFLAARLNGGLLPVYVNLDTSWDNPFQYFTSLIINVSLRRGFKLKESPQIETRDDFEQFVTSLIQQTDIERIVLLLDEFNAVIERIEKGNLSSQFLGDLRYLYMSPESKFSVVFADWYLIDELKSRVPAQLWTDFAREPISFLSEFECREAILSPAKDSTLRFEQETVSKIYDYTTGYPWHIQWICSELTQYLNIQKRYIALPQDIDLIVKRLLKDDRLFNEGVCRPERISQDDQCVLYGILEAISESGKDIQNWFPRNFVTDLRLPVDVNHVLSTIIQLEILQESENQLRFCSPLHALWLDEKRTKEIDICLIQKAKENQHFKIDELPENPDLEIKKKCESIKELKSQLRLALNKENQVFTNVEMPCEWTNASIVVRTEDTWQTFMKALRDLFVEDMVCRMDDWEDRKKYPDLNKELLSIRYRRNYVEHPDSEQGRKEEENCCLKDIDKRLPTTTDDWLILQIKTLDRLSNALQTTLEYTAKSR